MPAGNRTRPKFGARRRTPCPRVSVSSDIVRAERQEDRIANRTTSYRLSCEGHLPLPRLKTRFARGRRVPDYRRVAPDRSPEVRPSSTPRRWRNDHSGTSRSEKDLSDCAVADREWATPASEPELADPCSRARYAVRRPPRRWSRNVRDTHHHGVRPLLCPPSSAPLVEDLARLVLLDLERRPMLPAYEPHRPRDYAAPSRVPPERRFLVMSIIQRN